MKKYIEYLEGNIPLIISVPHGGSLSPKDIPNRTIGIFKKDRKTVLVAEEIISAFAKKGLVPYVVKMNLTRKKIDVNRGTKEGAPNQTTKEIHRDYHRLIVLARKKVSQKFGGGLLIDLHGQKHREGFVEVGYSIPKSKINELGKASRKYLLNNSSFGALLKKGFNPDEIVFGNNAFGTLLARDGYNVMPSASFPKIDHRHFNGVYILHRHVVTKKEGIVGVNLELCYEGIRDTAQNRQTFAKAFKKTTIAYLNYFFNHQI